MDTVAGNTIADINTMVNLLFMVLSPFVFPYPSLPHVNDPIVSEYYELI